MTKENFDIYTEMILTGYDETTAYWYRFGFAYQRVYKNVNTLVLADIPDDPIDTECELYEMWGKSLVGEIEDPDSKAFFEFDEYRMGQGADVCGNEVSKETALQYMKYGAIGCSIYYHK